MTSVPSMRVSRVEEVESTPLEVSHRSFDRPHSSRLSRPGESAEGASHNDWSENHDGRSS